MSSLADEHHYLKKVGAFGRDVKQKYFFSCHRIVHKVGTHCAQGIRACQNARNEERR